MLQKITLIILVSIFTISGIFANQELKIGTIERKPFSYLEKGEWTGFSVELFKQVALINNIKYKFVEYTEFSKMLDGVENNDIDGAVANISITLDREKQFDFSTSIYDSGLTILGLIENSDIILFSSKYMSYILKGLIYLSIFVIFLTHIFWITKVIQGFMFVSDYFSDILGIFASIISQIKNAFGLRILSIVFIVSCIFVVSYFSQTMTLLFNEQSDKKNEQGGKIHYKEIADTKIGVSFNSTAMNFLNGRDITTQDYSTINTMYDDLKNSNIDYIVADEPILQYYSKHAKIPIFSVVGKTFNPEGLGFMFQNNSELLENIDISILELKESGEYDEIYKKYFEK
ncbi:transporter substrate-binding domain-containing protein [Candidatus Gracilibacteria bacterium]|nr:transporter substrate-binding domain-containing protein [Candidatus Gracilibacteria bacterium]